MNFFGKRDGLVHVSQIENCRLNHPSDVVKKSQEVKLLGFDDRGKVRLSMNVVDQANRRRDQERRRSRKFPSGTTPGNTLLVQSSIPP